MSDAETSSQQRYFTCQGSSIGFKGGRYKAATPIRAAKKASRKAFKRIENDPKFRRYKDVKSIKIMIREVTRGSKRSVSYYEAVKLAVEPKLIEHKVDGKIIVTEHKYRIKLSGCDKFDHKTG
jgi:hypothetical protein